MPIINYRAWANTSNTVMSDVFIALIMHAPLALCMLMFWRLNHLIVVSVSIPAWPFQTTTLPAGKLQLSETPSVSIGSLQSKCRVRETVAALLGRWGMKEHYSTPAVGNSWEVKDHDRSVVYNRTNLTWRSVALPLPLRRVYFFWLESFFNS